MQTKYSAKVRRYRGGFRGITPPPPPRKKQPSCRQMTNEFVNKRKIFDKPDIVV